MVLIDREVFTFDSEKLPKEKFYVAGFEGTEALNTLFHFEISLLCNNAEIDTAILAGSKASFVIHREKGEDAVFNGYISKIAQGGRINGYSYYTVQLGPSLEKLKHVVNSMIFLDNDLKQTIEAVIAHERFVTIDYEFRFAESYPKKEFALQYNENAFDYILYRLEEQGAYFYFDKDGERVIFADNLGLHDPSRGTLYYSPTTGLELSVLDEVINSFTVEQKLLPSRVIVRNYHWLNPNKILVGIADVSKDGFGDVYLSNEKIESEEDAKRTARIRAEQILSESRIYTGTGSVPFLRPGVVFTLSKHFCDSFNRDYLITKIKHEGRQETLLNLVLGIPLDDDGEHIFYRNTFECIESDTTYRPARTVERPRIAGAIHAFIDGDQEGEPVMDKYGRYKIKFDFDTSGRSDGKASHWVRRTQEQVGKDYGFAFTLVPGTEVLITFVNGDSDQPVITRALPNGETGSISGGGNKDFSGLRASGGVQLTMENEHNTLELSNTTGSYFVFGAGSLDYLNTGTHVALKSSSVGASEAAGAMADNMSSFISRRRAVCSSLSQYLSLLLAAAAKTGQYAYDSLSGKSADPNEPKLDLSALAAKFITIIPFLKPAPYNIRLSASQKNASSRLQCFPSLAEITANIVIMLVARAGSAVLDFADNSNTENSSDASNSEQDSADIKKKVFRNKMVGQIANFLPELGVMIAVLVMYHRFSFQPIGGILIDAKDKNINLHANTYIGIHAKRGIYLNTITAKTIEEGTVWGAPKLFYTTEEKEFNDTMFSTVIPTKLTIDGEELLTKDIIHQNRNIREDPYNPSMWGSAAVVDPEEEKISFIVGNTLLYYMQCDVSYQIAAKRWFSYSNRFNLISKKDGEVDTCTVTAGKEISFNGTKGSILLSIPGEENAPSKSFLLLKSGDDEHKIIGGINDEYFRGIKISDTGIRLSMDKPDAESMLVLKGGDVRFLIGEKKDEVKGQLRIKVEKQKVKLTGKNVILGAVNLVAGNFKGAKNGKIALGGGKELIMNVGSSIEELSEKIEEEINKIEKEEDKKKEEEATNKDEANQNNAE